MSPNQSAIIQKAADLWAEDYFNKEIAPRKVDIVSAKKKALAVIVLTKPTRDYLAVNDPMALKQCQEALNSKSYVNYLPDDRELLAQL